MAHRKSAERQGDSGLRLDATREGISRLISRTGELPKIEENGNSVHEETCQLDKRHASSAAELLDAYNTRQTTRASSRRSDPCRAPRQWPPRPAQQVAYPPGTAMTTSDPYCGFESRPATQNGLVVGARLREDFISACHQVARQGPSGGVCGLSLRGYQPGAGTPRNAQPSGVRGALRLGFRPAR
jgi:hypothetical protein